MELAYGPALANGMITVPAGHPVRVSVCDFAVPKIPQGVWPLQVILPPVYPVLNCKVMEELSVAAATIVVLLGLVHLKTEAATCVAVGAATTLV